MSSQRLLVFSAFLSVVWCAEDWTFPPGFKFGASTAAYQVEGAWNVSDKGESIWDVYLHAHPDAVVDDDNGDVACDSYHLWERDIEMASELGLNHYRLSISWPRLLPSGFPNCTSEDGKRYYNNLIDGLLKKGIEPLVTLHHFDIPQTIQDLGGWTNPLIADWFADYARVAFSLFGDRVKWWVTINEPLMVCDGSYNLGSEAPGIVSPDHGTYLCNKYLLMAHAKAYRVYDEEFRHYYNGKISIANHLFWFEPWTENDEEAAELAREYCAGRYSHAIYTEKGGWPPVIEKILAEDSRKKGYTHSNLPAFTPEEIEFVKGTYDYYALNHYTSRIARPAHKDEVLRPWPSGDIPDLNIVLGTRPDWPEGVSSFFAIYPEGMRRLLDWLKKHYGDIEYVITENGFATNGGLNDLDRIKFYQEYMQQLLLAIKEDGVNATHYTIWAIMDNFEWTSGYSVKYGLYQVNFTDPLRERTPRDSARWYSNVIENNALDIE